MTTVVWIRLLNIFQILYIQLIIIYLMNIFQIFIIYIFIFTFIK